MRVRSVFALGALFAALTVSYPAQAFSAQPSPAQTSVALHPPLLPDSFAGFVKSSQPGAPPAQPSFALSQANKAALEECGPQQSVVETYTSGSRLMTVEAVDFQDASGASAAASILAQPNMRQISGLGGMALAGDGGVIALSGTAVAVAYPATTADVSALKALVGAMPKPVGAKALPPLLPTLLPSRGLLPGSIRYALGRETYMAEGGVLPAAGLGWNQSAEAVTARYEDRRGAETLTLLLYPTPTIAGAHGRTVQSLLPGLGSAFKNAKLRREGSLLILAEGTFSPDAANALAENTHLRQILSTDKSMPTPDVVETRKTFGLFANIIVFSGVLGLAAILLGIFLGGGRALVRIIQGKPAATEAEFLSLHLEPQNPNPSFSHPEPIEPA